MAKKNPPKDFIGILPKPYLPGEIPIAHSMPKPKKTKEPPYSEVLTTAINTLGDSLGSFGDTFNLSKLISEKFNDEVLKVLSEPVAKSFSMGLKVTPGPHDSVIVEPKEEPGLTIDNSKGDKSLELDLIAFQELKKYAQEYGPKTVIVKGPNLQQVPKDKPWVPKLESVYGMDFGKADSIIATDIVSGEVKHIYEPNPNCPEEGVILKKAEKVVKRKGYKYWRCRSEGVGNYWVAWVLDSLPLYWYYIVVLWQEDDGRIGFSMVRSDTHTKIPEWDKPFNMYYAADLDYTFDFYLPVSINLITKKLLEQILEGVIEDMLKGQKYFNKGAGTMWYQYIKTKLQEYALGEAE